MIHLANRRIGQRQNFLFFLLTAYYLLFIVAFLFASPDESNIAVSFNNIAGERAAGFSATVPYQLRRAEGYLSTQALSTGGLIRGEYHAEIGSRAGKSVSVVLFVDGVFKGYTVENLGRQSDLGAKIVTPDFDVGVFHVSGGIGVFGRNAGPFGATNAADVLADKGFNPDRIEENEFLASWTPDPPGLTIKKGNSFNMLGKFQAQHPSGLVVKIRIMPELIGDGDPLHQLIISPEHSWELRDAWNLQTRLDIGLQRYQGELESETASQVLISYSFDKLGR